MCDYIYNADGTFSKLNDIQTPTPTIAKKGCGCNERENFINIDGNQLTLTNSMMGNSLSGNVLSTNGKDKTPHLMPTTIIGKTHVMPSAKSSESNPQKVDAEKISQILKVLSVELKKISPNNISALQVRKSLVDLISSISNHLISNVNKLQDHEIYMIANKLSLLVDHINDSVEFSNKKMSQISQHINNHTSDINNHYTNTLNHISTLTNDIHTMVTKPTMAPMNRLSLDLPNYTTSTMAPIHMGTTTNLLNSLQGSFQISNPNTLGSLRNTIKGSL